MCEQIFTTDLIISANIDELSRVLNMFKRFKDELEKRFDFICSPEDHEYICGGNEVLVKVLPLKEDVAATSMGKRLYEVAIIRIEASHPEALVKINALLYNLLKEEGIKYRRGN